jgi:hypothetical protein
MANDKTQENETVLAQFKRNLDHIAIGAVAGPEITVGDVVLTFKAKAPVSALAKLVGTDNRIEGMIEYIKLTLVPGQDEALEALLGNVDIEGLAEILNVLGEGYTSFPDQS